MRGTVVKQLTDVDDRIIRRAQARACGTEVSERYVAAYGGLASMGCSRARGAKDTTTSRDVA